MAVAAPPGGAVRVALSVLAAAVVSSATVHVAARYVLGDVALQRAVLVGPVVPVVLLVLLVLGSVHPLAGLAVALVADAVAVRFVYDVGSGTAGLVAAVHYAVSLLLGITVVNAVQVLSTAWV